MTEKEDLEEFDDVIKEESKKPRGKIFCPECGSPSLYYFLGFSAGSIYVCKECTYKGPVVIEDGKIAQELRKDKIEKLEKEKEDSEDKTN